MFRLFQTTRVLRVIGVAACALASITFVTIAAADDAASPAELSSKAKTIIERMLAERQKINSAVVQVRGSQTVTYDGQPRVNLIRGTYTFDHAQKQLRFDNVTRMPIRVIGPDDILPEKLTVETLKQIKPKMADKMLRYVRNREYSAAFEKSTMTSEVMITSVQLRAPDGVIEGRAASDHHLIDLRACGVMNYYAFDRGDFESGRGVADYCRGLVNLPVQSVTDDDGLCRLVLGTPNAPTYLTVDTTRQFVPVEFRQTWRTGDADSPLTSESARVEWQEIAGVQVPKGMTIERDMPVLPDRSARCKFEYTWEKVNEPVEASCFDYRSFTDIPEGVTVIELRDGKPAIVGTWTDAGFGPKEVKPELPK